MPIVTDTHLFATQSNQPLDVELPALVGAHIFDVVRLKNDDFPAFGTAEVVGEPIHKQMVATVRLHLQYSVTFLEVTRRWLPGTLNQPSASQKIVRWERSEERRVG